MDNKQARYLHRMLDRLAEGKTLNPQDVEALRKNLPELPKQKTLEEIAWDMDFAWAETSGNDWKEEMFGNLETWLSELHSQLRAHLEGVKSQAHPALPAGMQLADHEELGRVVVSPRPNQSFLTEVLFAGNNSVTGAALAYVGADTLTPVGDKPAHPEFLGTEADYASAPEGTIVACEDSSPWYKSGPEWLSVDFCGAKDDKGMSRARRRVLRWGE